MACIFAKNNRHGRAGNNRARSNDAGFADVVDNEVRTGCNSNRAARRAALSTAGNRVSRNRSLEGIHRDVCSDAGVIAAAQAAETAASARNEQQGHTPDEYGICDSAAGSPIGDFLYGGGTAAMTCTSCCDPRYGCQVFNIADRDPFWPTFAHPRWLPCNQLYNGDPL